MSSTSILLVNDNPLLLQVICQFLARFEPALVIVGTATNSREGLAQANMLQPDILLLDLSISSGSGLSALPGLRAKLPQVGIIVLSLLSTRGYRDAVLAAGADAFIAKDVLYTELVPAIRQVSHQRKIDKPTRPIHKLPKQQH